MSRQGRKKCKKNISEKILPQIFWRLTHSRRENRSLLFRRRRFRAKINDDTNRNFLDKSWCRSDDDDDSLWEIRLDFCATNLQRDGFEPFRQRELEEEVWEEGWMEGREGEYNRWVGGCVRVCWDIVTPTSSLFSRLLIACHAHCHVNLRPCRNHLAQAILGETARVLPHGSGTRLNWATLL